MQELLEDLKGICKKHKIKIVDTSGVFFKEDGEALFKEVIITKNIIEVIQGGNNEK